MKFLKRLILFLPLMFLGILHILILNFCWVFKPNGIPIFAKTIGEYIFQKVKWIYKEAK